MIELKRRGAFSAARNYWSAGKTEAENRALFGKRAGQEGHGHNYVVELTASGELDARTDMVVNMADIDRVLKSNVLAPLDGRFLNREIAFFEQRPPTLENIAEYIWTAVAPALPERSRLRAVCVWETPALWAERREGDNGMIVSVTRSYEFSASHRLHSNSLTDDENRAVFGKCNNPHGHGHNYTIEVTMTGEPDIRTGMLYSLETLDRVVDEEVLSRFDHKHLNLDTPEFADRNPTSELLSVVVWEKLARQLPAQGSPRLSKVVVRETARNSFEYRGE